MWSFLDAIGDAIASLWDDDDDDELEEAQRQALKRARKGRKKRERAKRQKRMAQLEERGARLFVDLVESESLDVEDAGQWRLVDGDSWREELESARDRKLAKIRRLPRSEARQKKMLGLLERRLATRLKALSD